MVSGAGIRKPIEYCSIDDCITQKHARGLCEMHYRRELRRIRTAARKLAEQLQGVRIMYEGKDITNLLEIRR